MEKTNNPIKEQQEKIESLYLMPGTKIRLVKINLNKSSDIKIGDSLEGILDTSVSIGNPIYLDNKSKNTSPISEASFEKEKVFFKTNTSTYELVPPSDFREEVSTLPEIDHRIDILLQEAKNNSISGRIIKEMAYKRSKLIDKPKTDENRDLISSLDKEFMKYTVTVRTLGEFKILLKKLNQNYYYMMGTLAHENAHVNKGESLGALHTGYSIIVYKKDDGSFVYHPLAQNRHLKSWSPKEKIENDILITNSPSEYGNKLSPRDEEQIEKLRKQLKDFG